MQYFDDDGTIVGGDAWDVSVSVDDTFGETGSQTNLNHVEVGLLSSIIFDSGDPIGFPTVTLSGTNIEASADLILNNIGNYDIPGDGNVEVTGEDLCESVGSSSDCGVGNEIPTGNFDGSDDAVDPCAAGTSLVESTATTIPSVSLIRGTGTTDGGLSFCLTLVPAVIQSQAYSASSPHFDSNQLGPWQIGLS